MYIILLENYWYYSQNAGEECESQVIAVFASEEDYATYLEDNNITDAYFDCGMYLGEYVDDLTDDRCWYSKQILEDNR